jgi:uncharacterized protein (DUF1015 family)
VAEIEPLAGLDTVLAPPYDVVTAAQVQNLVDADEHNIVRIDHPTAGDRLSAAGEESYDEAACLLDQWLAGAVLAEDPAPSLYVVEHEFVHPWIAGTSRRTGIICLIPARPWDQAPIRPHERTFSSPKRDRLALLRTTRTQTSPIFGLWDGKSDAGALLKGITSKTALQAGHFEGDLGRESIRLWRIDNPSEIDAIDRSLADSDLYIADGHHRYETAAAFGDEVGVRYGQAHKAKVFTYLSASDDPGLFLLPTHRIVSASATSMRTVAELRASLDATWSVTEIDQRAAESPERSESSNVVAVAAGDGFGQLSRLRAQGSPRGALDVTALHEEVLPVLRASGASPIAFERDAKKAIQAVRDGAAAFAFIMTPPSVAEMIAVADAGETMPQKSTYFYPKIPTGLVLWRVE